MQVWKLAFGLALGWVLGGALGAASDGAPWARVGAGLARPASAQIGSDRYAAIVVEARSGAVLMEANADESRYPASLTKMMTLYMAFDALKQGRLDLNDRFPVSSDAAAMPPSRLGLPTGTMLRVEEAILALVTKSANDAAAALGEYLGGGSETRFAQMMTLRARALGMRGTTFRNASGLPDLDQVSTARDMAVLGRRLQQDHPAYYAYFSEPNFVFRGRTHWNHNRLLQEYDGTDGIKTGYVNDSGFNLVASAQRDGVRLIAAVFGGQSGRERDRHMMAILDQGFAAMGVRPREPVYARPAIVATARAEGVRSWRGVGPTRASAVAAGRASSKQGKAALVAQGPAGRRAGVLVAHRPGERGLVSQVPARAAAPAGRAAGFTARGPGSTAPRVASAGQTAPAMTKAAANASGPSRNAARGVVQVAAVRASPAKAAARVEQGDGGRAVSRAAQPAKRR